MKTIREIYNVMPLENAVMKDGKALFRVKDVIAAAKKKDMDNPEKLLKKEAKAGTIKIVIEKLVDFEPEARYIIRNLKTKKGKQR